MDYASNTMGNNARNYGASRQLRLKKTNRAWNKMVYLAPMKLPLFGKAMKIKRVHQNRLELAACAKFNKKKLFPAHGNRSSQTKNVSFYVKRNQSFKKSNFFFHRQEIAMHTRTLEL